MTHHSLSRRELLLQCACGILSCALAVPGRRLTMLDLIAAPSSLGLRPLPHGGEPGAWRAPTALEDAGLSRRVRPRRQLQLPRPVYADATPQGSRVRNGPALRDFSLRLSAEVEASLCGGSTPVVIGGDCSVLLGCLHGLRAAGGRGLIHVDGHSDFFHPGNYDPAARLGSAAGMDLALATGRGEALLTRWPGIDGPLVDDADVLQVGEREAGEPDYAFEDITRMDIEQLTVQWVRGKGVPAAVEHATRRLAMRDLARAWLHVDLDVLDGEELPAVDSPGSPGLTFPELGALLRGLVGTGRVAGLDVAIYDPDLDPHGRYAPQIVELVASVADCIRWRT